MIVLMMMPAKLLLSRVNIVAEKDSSNEPIIFIGESSSATRYHVCRVRARQKRACLVKNSSHKGSISQQ